MTTELPANLDRSQNKLASLQVIRLSSRRGLQCLLAASTLGVLATGFTDTPAGWINNSNLTAYSTDAQTLEISAAVLRVNDTLDVFNIREELLAGNRRLVGDSGDLKGARFELNYGVTEWLSVFYRQQQQALRVDVGEVASVNILDIDSDLDTDRQEVGVKWVFFEGDLLNQDDRISAAALELSAFSNSSDSFDVLTDSISLNGLNISFTDPRTFSVTDLDDDGWTARLLYSTQLFGSAVGSAWLGYRESESSSSTDSDIGSEFIARQFRQQFSLEENYWLGGFSLNFSLTPRLPVQLSYEYLRTSSSEFVRDPETPPAGLPGFLSASPSGEEVNHSFRGQISYWLTPDLHATLSGNLYSNQFLGVIPHFNNPLSGSFSDNPYGYLGLGIGYRFSF